MIAKQIESLLVATLLAFGAGVLAADSEAQPGEEALQKELGPLMMRGKAPEPKVMQDLFEKYRHLKSGHLVDTLLMATVSAYTEAGRWQEGVTFADKVLADDSFSVNARISVGLAKAYAVARGGDLSAAEAALDKALALDPEHYLAKSRDGIVEQLKHEVAKGKK